MKKETPTQVFSCEYCASFKNSFFTEHLRWLLLQDFEYASMVTTIHKYFQSFEVEEHLNYIPHVFRIPWILQNFSFKKRFFMGVGSGANNNLDLWNSYPHIQKQPLEEFCKKGVLRNFAKFRGKRLCQNHFFKAADVNV